MSQSETHYPTGIIDDHWSSSLRCSICAEYFLQPQLLQCGHSFCKICVEDLVYHSKWLTSLSHRDNYFYCPTCGRKYPSSGYRKRITRNAELEAVVQAWMKSDDKVTFILNQAESSNMSSESEHSLNPNLMVDLTKESSTQTLLPIELVDQEVQTTVVSTRSSQTQVNDINDCSRGVQTMVNQADRWTQTNMVPTINYGTTTTTPTQTEYHQQHRSCQTLAQTTEIALQTEEDAALHDTESLQEAKNNFPAFVNELRKIMNMLVPEEYKSNPFLCADEMSNSESRVKNADQIDGDVNLENDANGKAGSSNSCVAPNQATGNACLKVTADHALLAQKA